MLFLVPLRFELRLEFGQEPDVVELVLLSFLVHAEERLFVGIVRIRSHRQRLIAPSRGNQVAYEGHIPCGALRCQVGEADHQSAEQDLRNEQQGDADVDGHNRVEALRQQQSCEIGQERGDEQDEPPNAEQAVNAHDVVAYQDEQERLYQRDSRHQDNLRPDIAAVRQMEELLPLQQGAVLDDLLCAAAHADERCNNHRHEEVAHQILVLHHAVALAGRIACQHSANHRQHGSLEQGDAQVLEVRDLRLQVALQEDDELLHASGLLQLGGGEWGGFLLRGEGLGLGTALQIELVPLLRRHLPLVRRLATAADGPFLDDVQHDLGIHIPACRTGTRLGIGIARSLLEISDGVNRVAVENGIAPAVEQPQAVEQFINVARRLVDGQHDQPPSAGLLFQQVHQSLGVRRRQA